MHLPAALPSDPAQHSVDRDGASIVAIVAHDTQTPKPNGSSLNHLVTGGGLGVSIHVLINRDGTYYRLVPDTRGSNHAGYETAVLRLNGRVWRAGQINRVTLGFELERSQRGPYYPDVQLRTMGLLIQDWRHKWGPLPIVRHQEIDPTRRNDPRGLSVAQMEAWVERVASEAAPPPAEVRGWVPLAPGTWVRAQPTVESAHIATLGSTPVRGKEVQGTLYRGSRAWVALESGGYVWRGQLAPIG